MCRGIPNHELLLELVGEGDDHAGGREQRQHDEQAEGGGDAHLAGEDGGEGWRGGRGWR